MGHYECHYIQNLNPWAKNIKLYRRYIWDGTEFEFEKFTAYLNRNEYGITLTGKASSESVDYLDITLTTKDKTIIS